MQRVSIETTQNVDIEYDLASIGDRIGATLIDYAVLVVYVLSIILLAVIFAPSGFDIDRMDEGLLVVILALIAVPYVFYFLVLELALNGQTVGKRFMKIKVSRMDGRSPRFSQYLIRWLFRPIDVGIFYGIVGLLCIGIGEKGQRLGDILAGTTVIKLNRRTRIDNTALAQIAKQDDYQPTYMEADKLTDQEAALIEEVLSISTKTGDREPVLRLYTKVKQLLDIQTNETPEIFLRTVVRDHAHLSAK
ncbi:RDD family protein [Roseivirga sp. BDSF3-8]|uniref:RDD family protein n=1 Tax=Roseivirga sp. BDSF3-8 TaxID=3241598 RepID=UPI003531AE73